MNTESLIYHLDTINRMHPTSGMSINVIEQEGCIEGFRIEVFSFPDVGVCMTRIPAHHVYRLLRDGHDKWKRRLIRGG